MITQEQIQAFNEDGYLRYGRVLEMNEVDELRAALDEVISIELAGGDDSAPEFRFGHRRGQEQTATTQQPRPITQYVNMWKRSPAYERLLHHPVIAGVAAALLQTERVRLWHDQVISKPPGGEWPFPLSPGFLPLATARSPDPQLLAGVG